MRRAGRPRPILLAVLLAPLSTALGFVGFRLSNSSLSATDALYSALQLFALEGSIPRGGTPWQLDVARFLAPLAVVYAAVIAVVSLLHNQAQRLIVAVRSRGHVVVVGLGATGTLVAAGLRREGYEVVALEIDPDNRRVSVVDAEGVRVLIGDGTSKTFLTTARVHRARHVVVLTGEDSRNLEIAAVVREFLLDRGRSPTTVHVAIANLDLWKELSRIELAAKHDNVSIEYVSLADRTAQRLLGWASTISGKDVLPHVYVDGDTPVASRVIAHIARRGVLAGIRPSIGLSGEEDPLRRLRSEEPWCENVADITVVEEGPGTQAPALALVCGGDDGDADAISRGLVLVRRFPEAHVAVVVYRERSETALDAVRGVTSRMHLVSAKVDALGHELLARSGIEVMARVRHEYYLAQELARGSTMEDNLSLAPWDDLPETLKDSNRRFAEAVTAIVVDLGGELAPLLGPVPADGMPVTPEMLERLARSEHDRWMDALVRDGWTRTEGRKDPRRKLHPLLVPWEELDESEREKDRDAFRALPHMLARVGYSLVLPQQPTQ